MKNLRHFRGLLKEEPNIGRASHSPLGYDGEIDGSSSSIHDPSHKNTVRLLNAYLMSLSGKTIINPENVMKQLQTKLRLVGYHFDLPMVQSDPSSRGMGVADKQDGPKKPSQTPEKTQYNIGRTAYPLSYLGGRYGVLDQNHTIGKDDNIRRTNNGKGLNLVIQFTEVSGVIRIEAKIEETSE